MDLVKLTEYIITRMVKDPDTVTVKEFESSDDDVILLEVLISKDDIGRVIGKDGKIIGSIRTIVQAAASLNMDKKVNINIDSYVDYSDVFNIVKDTIYSLKLDYSAPFELRMNNFTYKEISILLDVPISSIDYKIKYVRKHLKNELRKLDNR